MIISMLNVKQKLTSTCLIQDTEVTELPPSKVQRLVTSEEEAFNKYTELPRATASTSAQVEVDFVNNEIWKAYISFKKRKVK